MAQAQRLGLLDESRRNRMVGTDHHIAAQQLRRITL